MLETFTALALAHVLADFFFQSNWMVRNKWGMGIFIHTIAVVVTAVLCLGHIGWLILWVAVVHVVIDIAKLLLRSDCLWIYLADQALHLVLIFILAQIFPAAWQLGLWSTFAPVWVPVLMAGLAGLVFATVAGQYAIERLLSETMAGSVEKSLSETSALIGVLERAIIMMLVLAGEPDGVGFLIAAKAISQFSADEQGKLARGYVIAGTFASFGWGLGVALATHALVEKLVV
jgi:hypothetical protein